MNNYEGNPEFLSKVRSSARCSEGASLRAPKKSLHDDYGTQNDVIDCQCCLTTSSTVVQCVYLHSLGSTAYDTILYRYSTVHAYSAHCLTSVHDSQPQTRGYLGRVFRAKVGHIIAAVHILGLFAPPHCVVRITK